jgi:hypothetical protein
MAEQHQGDLTGQEEGGPGEEEGGPEGEATEATTVEEATTEGWTLHQLRHEVRNLQQRV